MQKMQCIAVWINGELRYIGTEGVTVRHAVGDRRDITGIEFQHVDHPISAGKFTRYAAAKLETIIKERHPELRVRRLPWNVVQRFVNY